MVPAWTWGLGWSAAAWLPARAELCDEQAELLALASGPRHRLRGSSWGIRCPLATRKLALADSVPPLSTPTAYLSPRWCLGSPVVAGALTGLPGRRVLRWSVGVLTRYHLVMSSPLPRGRREEVLDAARDRRGKVRCAGCRRAIPDKWIQVDHVIPEYLGGTPDIQNLQPLCAPPKSGGCHRAKTMAEAALRKKVADEKVPGRFSYALGWLRVIVILDCLLALWGCWLQWSQGSGAVHQWIGQAWGFTVLAIIAACIPPAVRWMFVQPASDKPAVDMTKAPASFDPARIIEAARSVIGDKGTITVIDVEES